MRTERENTQAVTVSEGDRSSVTVTDKAAGHAHLAFRPESAPAPVRMECSGSDARTEIIVGRGACATVFGTSTAEKHTVSVTLEPESALHVIMLADGAALSCVSDLADGAKIFWHCFTLGSTGFPHALVSTLRGRHAKSDIDWVFSVRGSERQTMSVRNVFEASSGGGEITMKGVAEGSAYAACSGMIEIAEGGRGTDTYLTEDVLMLDPTAKIDAVPGLEIRTNDVKASHSATVSRVTVEDLFYFQSRGIPPAEARAMYTEGFLGELTERIPDEAIRHEVQKALMRQR